MMDGERSEVEMAPASASSSSPLADMGLAAFFLVVCAAVFWLCSDLPPGTFEPLGSAPVPQGTAGLIVLLALIMFARAVWRWWCAGVQRADLPFEPSYYDAIFFVLATLIYTGLLHARWFSFAPLTSVFLLLTMAVFVRFKPPALVAVLVVSVIVGYGCEYLFTRVFIVDLPGAY